MTAPAVILSLAAICIVPTRSTGSVRSLDILTGSNEVNVRVLILAFHQSLSLALWSWVDKIRAGHASVNRVLSREQPEWRSWGSQGLALNLQRRETSSDFPQPRWLRSVLSGTRPLDPGRSGGFRRIPGYPGV